MKRVLEIVFGIVFILIGLLITLVFLGQLPESIRLFNNNYPTGHNPTMYIIGHCTALLVFFAFSAFAFILGVLLLRTTSKSNHITLDEEMLNEED